MMMMMGASLIAGDDARMGTVYGGVLVAAILEGPLGRKDLPILMAGWPGWRLWIASP